jgi:arsenite methyltransferase
MKNDSMILESNRDVDTALRTQQSVREYYGRVLSTSADLKTSACCLAESLPEHHREILAQIHPEVLEKFYGCGSPIPHELEGRVVLDLGCGSGRDCYLLSRLVGPQGRVIGVDMTPEQLRVARRHVQYHMDRWGYAVPNLEFREGYIEDLQGLGIEDGSVDIVVSNCVVNLSPDKERVFSEIFRVLKPGGELHFSDVFSGRRVPAPLTTDPVLLGECLGGALYVEDFRRMLRGLDVLDHRVVSRSRLDLHSTELEAKAGMIDFYSMTIRAFKLPLEDICEDYGQVAFYLGTIPHAPHAFTLDDHHVFRTGMPVLVCGNTASMLQDTRFGHHFRVIGDRSVHYGPFACAPAPPAGASTAGGGCC